ncbi:hypothetical protein C8R44DRAFT_797432, partial [Mycena epipterygia]
MSTGGTLTQIDGLWFSSDALILRAENSIFRVTKSILVARSPVFQSMFDTQPAPNEETESPSSICTILPRRSSHFSARIPIPV